MGGYTLKNTIDYDEKIKQLKELKKEEVVEDEVIILDDPEELYEVLAELSRLEVEDESN